MRIISPWLHFSSSRLIAPLPYDPASREIVKAVLFLLHGLYDLALRYLDGEKLSTTRIARYVCHRELGRYAEAGAELHEWATRLGLAARLRKRLDVHEARYAKQGREALVGSAAMLLEQKLLAYDALAAAQDASFTPDLARYFHQDPVHLNIEDVVAEVELC